jgi:F0F1-type ATP synthase assembly protein I
LGLAYAAISLSAEMIAPILLGWWIDNRWHTSPIFVLAGTALGMTAGTWGLIKLVQKRPPTSAD